MSGSILAGRKTLAEASSAPSILAGTKNQNRYAEGTS
jgi:hypothetical protein